MAKSYVGRCKCGGVLAAASAIKPDGCTRAKGLHYLGQTLTDWLRQGLTIDRMEDAEIRRVFGDCSCTDHSDDICPCGDVDCSRPWSHPQERGNGL